MASSKARVTAVIPAFNEEKTIAEVIDEVKPFCNSLLVVLSKKSSDATGKIAKSKKVKVIEDNGLGKGEGMRCAINEIEDGVIVFIDADGSHIPNHIPKLVEPIARGEADMVIASRFLGGSEELHGDFNKFLRMFFSQFIALVVNLRFNAEIQDTQNGFRAISAKAAKSLNLNSNHTEIETEITMKCFKKGFRVLEIPSLELKRKFGESNISLSRHGWAYAWQVLRNLL